MTIERHGDKKTAPSIKLPLELLLDDYPASWIHLSHAILLW
ncbi:unnamed protein product [Penicillium roqueforti FM164]|uniref:Genomic scaffold, ProqFM164S02 n=1 Tax=Penicillium roqueforti (strain FM164) TaxID=1365484 RepID=W6QGH2_PENRF|nr:unnamed protein product [Penicillium roqueforti FM164]